MIDIPGDRLTLIKITYKVLVPDGSLDIAKAASGLETTFPQNESCEVSLREMSTTIDTH